MSDHRFKLGQQVRIRRAFSERVDAGAYEVVRLLPEDGAGEFQYRVVGPDRVERAVLESQLRTVSDRAL